jgi:hypothetical protein
LGEGGEGYNFNVYFAIGENRIFFKNEGAFSHWNEINTTQI